MAKGSNTWIWWTIGGISLLGLGVGAYIFFKDRKEKNAQAGSETDASPSPSNSSSSSSSSSGSSSNNTPFKNRTEGNAFRAWVNDNHSDYARSIDLDRTGPFNNPNIQKAWKQYGSAYSNRGATTQSTPANTTRTLESIANDLRDGGLVQDVKIDTKNNRVRGLKMPASGVGPRRSPRLRCGR